MHYTFFTHSPVNGHSSCFYVLVIANSVSVNLGLRVYLDRFLFVIYWVALSLSCSNQDLRWIMRDLSLQCIDSSYGAQAFVALWHVGS